jgi:hypothetical protein
VVAVTEDVVDSPSAIASPTASTPSGDLARASTERGEHGADDQGTHHDGLVGREVNDHDDRHRDQSRNDPPPRLRNCARRFGQHRRTISVTDRDGVSDRTPDVLATIPR